MTIHKFDYCNILGDPSTRASVMAALRQDPESYSTFQEFPPEVQEEMIAFCMGNAGLKLTYDPFFKYIFNPELKPERLSEFLSLLLQENVEVIDIFPNESNRISDKASLLITDILVRLSSGSLANIEIQRIGYRFPGARCACYSSDMLMRQLARAKREAKRRKKKFSYKQIKKVYTIVLIENSPAIYWDFPNNYLHRSKQVFDTGLKLDLLQEYIIIPLDVFKKIKHNEISKLEAWLYFIGSDSPKDIGRIVELYPEFKELYNELLALRYDVKELVNMYDVYRNLLRELDEEAVEYMVEEQRKEIEENKKIIDENQKVIDESKKIIADQKEEIARLKALLEMK